MLNNLCPCNKFHLIVVYGTFNVLLDLENSQYHVGS